VPEQKHWKEMVHEFSDEHINDPIQTAAEIQKDDGFGLGMIYQNDRPAWMPPHFEPESEQSVLDDMEKDFQV
jgi:2-oxoglutarate ferredoxin oxidoreductase subunit beta